MKLDGQAGVSVAELVIYSPALIVATIICARHGFGRSSGWIFSLILCLVRIVGACCQLAMYQDQSKGLLEATIILESIGISPLLLATLGLLSRCADSANRSSRIVFSSIYLRVTQLGITVGLILCIAGGTSSVSSSGVYDAQETSKAGVVLYIVCYIALGATTLLTLINSCYLTSEENRVAWAVIVAMPLILVRLIYSLLVTFDHSHQFNILSGSALIHALMAVLEEMLIVLIYLGIGWTLAPGVVAKTFGTPLQSRPGRGNMTVGTDRNGVSGRRRGPIHSLIGMAVESTHNGRSNNNDNNINSKRDEESV